MPDETDVLTRDLADSVTAPEDGRTIEVRLMRFGEVAEHTREGIRETFARGAFDGTDPRRVTLESQAHGGPLVGVAESITTDDQQAVARFRVSETPAGDELLTLARDGVLSAASVVFKPTVSKPRPDGVIERQSVELRRVAILERGAYPSATVLAVRNEEENRAMEMQAAPAAVDNSEILRAIGAVNERMGALETLSRVPATTDSPLLKFRNAGEYLKAAFADSTGELSRALADNIQSANPGLAQSQWLGEIKNIVDLGRRGINAMGGPEPVGDFGMKTEWPQFGGTLTGLVAKQATQKTEVQSGTVSFTNASATLETYAGGGDIAIQLIERSTPAYLDGWFRVQTAAWGIVCETAFGTQLIAGATGAASLRALFGAAISGTSTAAATDDIWRATAHGLAIGDAIVTLTKTGGTGVTLGQVYWVIAANFASGTFSVGTTPGAATALDITVDMTAYTFAKFTDTTGLLLRSRLFEASVTVENATGSPTTSVLASTDWFILMASMSGIVPPIPPTNTYNASGTALASTLRIVVSGLEIVRMPSLAAGTIIASTPAAARWREDGPRVLTANDVTKLGVDKAIYSYGVTAIYTPAGIVKLSAV